VPGQVDTNLRFKTTGYFDFVGYGINSIPNVGSAGNITFRDSSIVRWNGAALTGGTAQGLTVSTYYGSTFVKTINSEGPTVAVKKYTGQSDSLFEWQDTDGSVLGRINNAGNIAIGSAAPTAKLHLPAGTTAAGTAPLKFEPTSATLMTAAENGAMEFDGTDYYLTAGGTRRKIATSSGGSADYVLKTGDTMTGALMVQNGAGKSLQISHDTFNANILYAGGNNELLIGNSGGNRNLYLHSNGGVSVGNGGNSPSANGLLVVGDVLFGNSSVESGRIGFTPSTRTIKSGSAWTANQAGYDLTLSGGNSGAGTNIAGGELILSSGSATGTGGAGIQFKTTSLGGSGAGVVTPTTKMVILPNGNVGIGTAGPTQALDVNGQITTNNTFTVKSGANDRVLISYSGLNGIAWLYDNTNTKRIDLNTAGDSFFNGGNVAIGTTVPSSALDVNGAVTMRGMAAPAVSSAGQARLYFDSGTNTLKISQNTGAYVNVVGSCAAPNTQYFTASGTWNKPTTTCSNPVAVIKCVGGGGAGGAGGFGGNNGGGGGGGGYAETQVALSSLGASVTVTIGAGGAGTSSGGAAPSGGNTTFGATLTAGGGAGGNSNGTGGAGGASGGSGGGAGRAGGAGLTAAVGGTGGGAGAGHGDGGSPGTDTVAGGAGGTFGGGGGGGGSQGTSGSGAAGMCVVTVYDGN
jgi:hypothetical protein